jgi:hypothetical protein
LEHENITLEKDLRNAIQTTQGYLQRKEALEKQNKELIREKQLREGVLQLRSEKVSKAVEKEKLLRKQKLKAQNEHLLSKKQRRLREIWGKFQEENPVNGLQLKIEFSDSDDSEDYELMI